MPSILNLKFKGNKSFVAFSNLNDTESLTKTWKVCTKVASYLEQGSRLENLSWRLWHLQNLMVDTDNAKSKREFKKLSKCMGDKLDKEKGRSIEELEAPDFKRNHSTDMIRQRAVEKERSREASQNAKPGTIKRMQFTFSIDQPAPTVSAPVKKPDTKPSPELSKKTKSAGRSDADDMVVLEDEANDKDPPLTHRGRKTTTDASRAQQIRFPSLFSNDFGPSALLYPTPTLTTRMNYGEGFNPSSSNDGFSIMRPTIELPLDELLNDSSDSPGGWSLSLPSDTDARNDSSASPPQQRPDVLMKSVPAPLSDKASSASSASHESDDSDDSDDEDSDMDAIPTAVPVLPPISQAVKEVLPQTIAPSRITPNYRANTPTGRPALTVRTQATATARAAGPSATATSLNPAVLRQGGAGAGGVAGNSAPGGVKAECSNCGATHTPLWRRGLNDELNCNACGLYCKLHKRPRPKSMRNAHGEGRTQAAPRQEAVDVMAQCYNCHTTATPLWRKDDEGKTVCNACGLYYKLHGSARPISMKSDVIRKRSRHDARRNGNGVSETPSASPGVSRRASPARDISPTLAPDSTTQMYDYSEESDYRGSSTSELMGALGNDGQHNVFTPQGGFAAHFQFPGPYHPDHITNYTPPPLDALPFASVDSSDIENIGMSPRTNKRRRMSTDSASEPPSSATSYSSYNDGYSTSSSATSHSQRSSMDFPFSSYQSAYGGPALRGSGNAFWHPPMMPQNDHSPNIFHPPLLPPADESPMDYLHPPMVTHDEENLFSAYLHPPMALPDHGAHAQMFGGEYSGHNSEYDTNMRIY